MSLIDRAIADVVVFGVGLLFGLGLYFTSSPYQEGFWFPLLLALVCLVDFVYLIYRTSPQNPELNK